MKNSSRNYYNSHDNMSDIKESIEEYSMNFDKDSNAHSYQQQSISEDIQHSKTNKLASQSIAGASKSKKNLKTSRAAINEQTHPMKTIPPTIKQTLNEEPETGRKQQTQFDRPIDLGFQIWQTIHQRFYETNKISTEDPDVLYNFYISQRKVIKPRSMKVLDEQFYKLDQLMPSMHHKMQIKLQFEKMLLYKPQDIQYSLEIAAQMKIKDRELKKNEKILHMEMKITQTKKNKPIHEVVERLYGQPKTKPLDPTKMAEKEKQQGKMKLHQFGRRLSEAYLNAMREIPQNRVETLAKLHRFWSELYDREEYGLQWKEQTAQQDIKQYIIEQIQNLKSQYARKTGFLPTNGKKLFIFLNQNKNHYGIYINPISFEEYVKVFNEDQQQKQKKQVDLLQKKDNNRKKRQKEEEMKKFGRPVSATPLTILAKPKTKNDYSDLYTKYSHDKLVSTLIMEDQLKKHRYAFEYSVYDLVEQLKIKGRVRPAVTQSKDKDSFAKKGKIDHLQTYDDSIKKMLTKSFLTGSMIQGQSRDRVEEMLNEQNIHEQKIWEKMSPLLQEAMLIKSYEEEWFREPILKYTNKITNKDLKHENDKSLFHQLFTHLDKQQPHTRQTQLHNLQIYIEASQKIHKNKARIETMENKGQRFYRNQRKLMYADLVQRVIHFIKLQSEIRQGKTEAKITKREFINQTYKLFLKSHNDAVKKYFNAVDLEGAQCPNLLRYQFYRIAKQINPITFQRDACPRAPNWIPTKKTPQDFNYKTHNKFSNVYNKNKTRVVDPEPAKRAQSLWGKKNLKDREKLLMTYSDAKECYFHPQIKKQDQ